MVYSNTVRRLSREHLTGDSNRKCVLDAGIMQAAKRQMVGGDGMSRKIKNLAGKKFGSLTVVEMAGRERFGAVLWLCRCECGKESIVMGGNLTNGHTKSCGCKKAELAKATIEKKKSSYKSQTLCWDCIRSAAPPSLQCARDKSGGKEFPDGAEYFVEPTRERYDNVTVVNCPEYLSMHDRKNAERLRQERKKNNDAVAKEQGKRVLSISQSGRERCNTDGWWKAK